MGIIDIITGIIDPGIGDTVCGTEVFLPAFPVIGTNIFDYTFTDVIRWFIILRIISVNFFHILVVTVFQGYEMPHKFALGTSQCNFLPSALLVIPGNFITVTVIIRIFVSQIIQGQVQGCFFFIQPGLPITKFIVPVVCAAKFPTDLDAVAGTPEVFIAYRNHAHKPVGITIAGADTKGAGIHFRNSNFHFHRIRFPARVQFHVNVFKKAQVLNPVQGAAGQGRIKGFAFFQANLP